METRRFRVALLATLLILATSSPLLAARRRSANFIVDTPDPAFAAVVAKAAEKFRHDLAIEWLGKAMPDWSQPCTMTVRVGPGLGAGGATTFVFDRGEVFGWRMTIQGSRERLLDSVLPHEITHMIFASHFRQPLPRWADEGGATCVEHDSERAKHRKMLRKFLKTGRGIAFSRMFAMREYPADIMPLYAQGYSLADYLIQQGGKKAYIRFLEDGLKSGQWSAAISRHYGLAGLGKLQTTWLAWFEQGSPRLKSPQATPPAVLPQTEMVAVAGPAAQPEQRRPRPDPNLIYHMAKPKPYAPGSVVPAGHVATNAPRQTKPSPAPRQLPKGGWQVAGRRPKPIADSSEIAKAEVKPPATPPADIHVAHPQPFERPRQIILEWSEDTIRR